MVRDETVALFLEGREAWNAWADDMLAARRALEADGIWAAKRNSSGHLEPQNAETDAWMRAAAAIFSFCVFLVTGGDRAYGGSNGDMSGRPALPAGKPVQLFDSAADFSGFVFPGDVWFDNAAFPGDTSFSGAAFLGSARFDNAAFLANAWLTGAMFSGYTRFNGAVFTGNVWFESAAFAGGARFDGASFSGNALFGSTKFAGSTGFNDAKFLGYASFASAIFSGGVRFSEAIFSGGAWFSHTVFKKRADFELARFTKKAVFDGAEAEHAFILAGANFSQAPLFSRAEFALAPELSGMTFPLPRFWEAGNPELIAAYRSLKRMARESAEHRHMAFKGELRSRRWTSDKWRSAALWLGLLYDAAADCGRSIARPASLWVASVLAFGAFYWQQAAAGAAARCVDAGGAGWQALLLSLKNALVIYAGARGVAQTEAYLCLYGGNVAQPLSPPAVTLVEMLAQTPLSAALIFLCLLAVRSRFRIE